MLRRTLLIATVISAMTVGWSAPAHADGGPPVTLNIAALALQTQTGSCGGGSPESCTWYSGPGVEVRTDGTSTTWSVDVLEDSGSHGCFGGGGSLTWKLTDAAGNTLYGDGFPYTQSSSIGSTMRVQGGTGRFAGDTSGGAFVTQPLFLGVGYTSTHVASIGQNLCTTPYAWAGAISLTVQSSA
jgi:hypothetical protein